MISQRALTLIELLTVLMIVAVLAAVLMPVVGMVRDSSRRVRCASSLREIGVSVQAYANDQRGYYPTARQEGVAGALVGHVHWFELLLGYCEASNADGFAVIDRRDLDKGGRNVLKNCPSRGKAWGIHDIGYGMNAAMKMPESKKFNVWKIGPPATFVDYRVFEITKPAQRALVGDGKDWFITVGNSDYSDNWVPTRHRGRSNYLICDLHVQAVEPVAAQAAIANPGSIPLP